MKLKSDDSTTVKISTKLLLGLFLSFFASLMIGMKSSAYVRQVISADQNFSGIENESAWSNVIFYEESSNIDGLIQEDNDEDDSDDDISLGKFYKTILMKQFHPTLKFNTNSDDYDDDEEVEDEVEIQRLYQVSGMSHQVHGTIDGIQTAFLSSNEKIIHLITIMARGLSQHLLSVHCTSSDVANDVMKSCIGITTERGSVAVYTNPKSSNKLVFNVVSSGKEQVNVEKVTIYLLETYMIQHYLPSVLTSTEDNKSYYNDEPTLNWRIRLRNFPEDMYKIRNPYCEDLADGRFLENTGAIKKHIDTIETPFQRIDVYDFVDIRHTNHGSHMRSHNTHYNGNAGNEELMVYEKQHPELFKANRVIFLDGVLQSLSRGNEAYHEALVQPAMFAHPNPKRVAIIGGGEGATLREALKHKGVDKVLMIDIDEIMCKESARLLYPAWNSCDDFEDSVANSCFDDPRADVRYEDALAFFINRFNSNSNPQMEQVDKLDVIIMDALDPQDQIPFAEILYKDYVYWESLYNALTDDGILVAQLGDAPEIADPAEDYNEQKNRVLVLKTLQKIGFVSMHVYEESHCAFGDPWTFLIACKSINCRKHWYRTEAEIELAIHERILRSKSGKPLLQYFDGNTMSGYHNPPKAMETVYCRTEPTPKECLFDKQLKNQITTTTTSSLPLVRVSSSTKTTLYKYLHTKSASAIQNYAKLYAKKGQIRKKNMYRDNYDHYEFYLKTNVIEDSTNSFMNNNLTQYNISIDDLYRMSNLTTLDIYNNMTNAMNAFNNSASICNQDPFDYINSYSPIVDRHHYLYASFLN